MSGLFFGGWVSVNGMLCLMFRSVLTNCGRKEKARKIGVMGFGTISCSHDLGSESSAMVFCLCADAVGY